MIHIYCHWMLILTKSQIHSHMEDYVLVVEQFQAGITENPPFGGFIGFEGF